LVIYPARRSTRLILAAAVLFAGAASAANITPLERATVLANSGAPHLALRVLDELQPAVTDRQQWWEWERLRLSIFSQLGDWDGLSRHLSRLPADTPLLQQYSLITQGAEMLMAAGHGNSARRYLRDLLWRGSGDSNQVSYWRRLVIRSYIDEGNLDDARSAVARYQADYLPNDLDWAVLYGRMLLLTGAPREAAAQLATIQSEQGRLMRLTARLRAKIDDPRIVIQQAEELRERSKAGSEVKERSWGLTAEAARSAGDNDLRVRALERFVSAQLRAKEDLFPYTTDDLWDAYVAVGESVGNDKNLLIGDARPWLEEAASLKTQYPERTRSIYALLALKSDSEADREKFHLQLYQELRANALLDTAVNLYLKSRRFADIQAIPPLVRHRIVQYAIAHRDFDLAGRMSRDLEQTAGDQSRTEWNMVRARLAIYTGRFSDGAKVLDATITPSSQVEAETADAILQVIFDLQSVGENEAAYDLLAKMYDRVSSDTQKREILFWMADAMRNAKKFQKAAELYFRSALHGSDGFDEWGQTARYHAAQALADAGLIDDARRIYEALLKVSRDPKRVLTLEQQLQRLWLKNQKQP